MAPGNVCAAALQLSHQLHIFMAGQWFEPAGAPIGLGTDAQVGAVNVPMAVSGLVMLVIANLCRFVE